VNLAPGTNEGLHPTEVALFQRVLAGLEGEGVEIGCCDGYSSVVILAASQLHLTSIDPFVPDSMSPTLIGDEGRYRQNVAPFGDRATLIKGYSQHVPWVADIDFLFIDGDHTYEAVIDDWDWTLYMKTGGLLAMHDSRMSRPGGAPFHVGPSRVADDLVYGRPNHWEIMGEAFSLTVARKLV